MKKGLFTFLLLIITTTIFSQNRIFGKVTDEQNIPLEGASVYLNNTTIGVSTKTNGGFELKIKEGVYELIVSYIGYKTQQFNLKTSNYTQPLLFKLKIEENLLNEITLRKTIYNAEASFQTDGQQFDQLFSDGETFLLGEITCQILHTPGHTPACLTYLIGEIAFVGDTLFMPDFGTARADFPGGDAGDLYDSIHKILTLPKNTRLFTCHDYAPNGREIAWETTVREQRKNNLHVHDGISRDQFIKMRTDRDKQLAMPALLLPSIQVNMRAGELPPEEDNGTHYLKIPLNKL